MCPSFCPSSCLPGDLPVSLELEGWKSFHYGVAFVPYNVETVAEVSVDEDGYSTASGERTNLLDHHLALLLVVFIDANLFDV